MVKVCELPLEREDVVQGWEISVLVPDVGVVVR